MKLRIVLKDYMHYPEIKALVDKLEAEQAAVEPISLDELDDYNDPESMEESELEELLPRLEHLQDQLYDEEPNDEESEE